MSHSELANTHPYLGALLVVGFIVGVVAVFAIAALTSTRRDR